MSNRWLSVREVSEITGYPVYTVREAIKSGRLVASRPGRDYRVRQSDLDAWFDANIVGAAPSQDSRYIGVGVSPGSGAIAKSQFAQRNASHLRGL